MPSFSAVGSVGPAMPLIVALGSAINGERRADGNVALALRGNSPATAGGSVR